MPKGHTYQRYASCSTVTAIHAVN